MRRHSIEQKNNNTGGPKKRSSETSRTRRQLDDVNYRHRPLGRDTVLVCVVDELHVGRSPISLVDQKKKKKENARYGTTEQRRHRGGAGAGGNVIPTYPTCLHLRSSVKICRGAGQRQEGTGTFEKIRQFDTSRIRMHNVSPPFRHPRPLTLRCFVHESGRTDIFAKFALEHLSTPGAG